MDAVLKPFIGAHVQEEEEEEEAVDHQEVLREKCSELAKCSTLKEKLDTCNERVSGKSNTTEDCSEELFDFVHCVDHCVSLARGVFVATR